MGLAEGWGWTRLLPAFTCAAIGAGWRWGPQLLSMWPVWASSQQDGQVLKASVPRSEKDRQGSVTFLPCLRRLVASLHCCHRPASRTKELVRSAELGKDVTLSLAVGALVGLSREDYMWLGRGGDGPKWGAMARSDIW